MDIAAPWLIPNPDDVEHWGIGMGLDEDVLRLHCSRSHSPGSSSISLSPEKAELSRIPASDGTSSPPFRRSSAPSPESPLAAWKSTSSSLVLPAEQTGHGVQIGVSVPKTPEVEPTSSLSTTPTFAGPMKSYLACPHTHERRALCLPADGDTGDDDSEPGGSVVMGKRRLPGVYRERKRSQSPAALPKPKTPRLAHAMQRYLASTDSHELLAYQMQETRSQAAQAGQHDNPSQYANPPGLSEAAFPISGDSIPIAARVEARQGPSASTDRPIEVGTQQSGTDSAISDLETDELHQQLAAYRRTRDANQLRTHRDIRAIRGRVERKKRMRTRNL